MVEGQTYFVVHKLSVSFKYVVILSLLALGCYERSVIGMETYSIIISNIKILTGAFAIYSQ